MKVTKTRTDVLKDEMTYLQNLIDVIEKEEVLLQCPKVKEKSRERYKIEAESSELKNRRLHCFKVLGSIRYGNARSHGYIRSEFEKKSKN
ncbi:hypothetical protein JOD43_002418 [Pullulanibacillus pueri]|uniref:Uncharacterized protein n=1 Tax=Pullulanibacillus pueri TaxID=1437324 RepID=A0A8J2ZVH3_9BACL|nr:hypothetical protein [Pullulanibacillus pueri]GGH80593.1 hypothetical protein GCM10007096_17240 [Pullulanibacillus pueri]